MPWPDRDTQYFQQQFYLDMKTVLILVLSIYLTAAPSHAASHKELVYKALNYGFDRNFVNVTFGPRNETHLPATYIYILKQIPVIFVSDW